MITYADESLFYQDNVEKQLNISFSGGSITNSNIRAEEFELKEVLNSTDELKFGECNSSRASFVVGYYSDSIAGKTITITTTPSGASDFQIGIYKVLSDYPTADKRRRKIIAYDKLYDVLKADVTSWYNTFLPNTSTTKTLKQFRDSFFSYVGITQETQTLPNDSMTITRTINPSCITGKTILNKICEANGCFGRITRSGTFKYITLEKAAAGLFPSNTLYPKNDIYPRRYGFSSNYNHTYIELKYEDFLVKPIDKLEIKNSRGDTQVTINNGNNAYIISDNFLLFDKSDNDLITIGNKIYTNIEGRFYRPSAIKSNGNPCIEVGDGLRLFTIDGVEINTYVFERTLKGIHSLKDDYLSKGHEYRANDKNTTSEQFVQVKDNIRKIEADYVKTTYLEANYVTTTYLEANYVTTTYLTTNYLTANEISTDYLKTSDISTITLSASQITSGTIDAARIGASTITGTMIAGDTITVDNLKNTNGYFSFGNQGISSNSYVRSPNMQIYHQNIYKSLKADANGNVYVDLI